MAEIISQRKADRLAAARRSRRRRLSGGAKRSGENIRRRKRRRKAAKKWRRARKSAVPHRRKYQRGVAMAGNGGSNINNGAARHQRSERGGSQRRKIINDVFISGVAKRRIWPRQNDQSTINNQSGNIGGGENGVYHQCKAQCIAASSAQSESSLRRESWLISVSRGSSWRRLMAGIWRLAGASMAGSYLYR